MVEKESASNKTNTEDKMNYLKVVFLAILGIGITGLSIAIGKQLSWGELVYDAGLAVIIAAIVDLLIVRAIAEWKSEEQKLVEEGKQVIGQLNEFKEEMNKQMLQLTAQSTASTVNSIESLCQNIVKEIDKIRRSTDSGYALLEDAAETQENSR